MSWLNLNQSLNSLKGQITNFASEVLSEGAEQDSGDNAVALEAPVKELEEKCRNQELEIASLKKLTQELQASLQSERLSVKNGVKEEESSWYWDPAPQKPADDDLQYKMQIKALQEELSSLKERDTVDIRQDTDEEINRLREENKNLTMNLEDLDSQHQLAMERLLSLKKELQKNFEVLRQEHEDLKNTNDDYAEEIKDLLSKIAEKDRLLESITTTKSDYDTLHQKYMNLERIHGLLRENAEKFQEENQELHEEVFKLQEQVTKLEHDIETVSKQSETSDTVPRDTYDELLKELNELKQARNSNHDNLDEINIDDNAKSVIETLKRDLSDLRHRLAQKENIESQAENKVVKSEKIMQLYNKYVNFELPVDYLGEVPSGNDNIVIFKLESAFKTLNSFKKDIDILEQKLSEKNLNISHLQTQIDDLTSENDFLTNDLQHFERELEEMKKNNDFLISEIAALKNTSKLEPIIETHEDNLAKLETELADSNRINKTFESEIKRIQKELMAVQNEKTLLHSSLIDLKEKYTVMVGELDMFKAQTKAVEELENKAYVANEEKLKNMTDEIHDLKKRINAANTKNEQLSIDVHIVENDKVLLTQEIDNLKQEILKKDPSRNTEQNVDEVDGKMVRKVNLQDNSSQPIQNEDKDNDSTKALKELERVTLEKARTLEKLAASMDENSTLKASIAKLSAEVNNLKQHEQQLLSEINELKNNTHSEAQNASILQETIENLKAKVIQHEMVTDEVNKLQEENAKLTERKLQLEAELSSTDTKIVHLEEEFEKLISDLGEKDTLIDSLNSTINENNAQIANFSTVISELENNVTAKNNEIQTLQKSLVEVNQKLNETTQSSHQRCEILLHDKEVINEQVTALNDALNRKNIEIDSLNKRIKEEERKLDQYKEISDKKDSEIVNLQKSLSEVNQKLNEACQTSNQSNEMITHEKEALNQQLIELNADIQRKNDEISLLNTKIEEADKRCSQYKSLADDKDKEIKELQQRVVEISDKLKNLDNSSNADDFAILLKDKENLQNLFTELQNNITMKEHELNDVKVKCDNLEKACVEYKTLVDNTTAEKTELINLVNLKHNESLQYHNEIQRLNQVLLEQSNEFKRLIELKNDTGNESCQLCENLRITLREKDEIIMSLNQNSSVIEKYKVDLQNANESLKVLTEKCEALEKDLTLQLDAVKKLTAEKLQLSDQHENATRELERLRHHLMETEETYTQELMTSEQKLTECQARLAHVEERAKQSSTVYTSNSIRANQEVETYKNQIKLLEKQREEVQARLSEAEDARSRSEAALTNLQVVLEQFQLDKERDIHAATEKIRNKMEDLRRENGGLQAEINKLNEKLQESIAGLQAATRLGDQLETKTAQINDLKEQDDILTSDNLAPTFSGQISAGNSGVTTPRVPGGMPPVTVRPQWYKLETDTLKTLQTSVGAAEERYYNAISNQQDKVDKNLVKNLVLNFVMTAGNSTNKTQVLRILSTVLDFNQMECAKLGLAKGQPTDSLAAEFVKFLQDESKPRAALPSMMGLTRSTSSSSRKSSTIGPSPIPSEALGHKRNPSTGSNNLLFQNIDNIDTSSQISIESDHRDQRSTMETGVNQTRNTEGAILKHVLKDM